MRPPRVCRGAWPGNDAANWLQNRSPLLWSSVSQPIPVLTSLQTGNQDLHANDLYSHSVPALNMADVATMVATKNTMTCIVLSYWDIEDLILHQGVLVLNFAGDKISVIWSLCLVTPCLASVPLYQLYSVLEVKYWSSESHLAPNWAILLLSTPTRQRR